MSKRAFTITILLIVAGLSLLLYPTVSDYEKSMSYRRAISDYISTVEPMDDGSYTELLEAAQAYNQRLAEKGHFSLSLSKEELAEYNGLLAADGTGVMGYVSVPKVGISLPIYHGTGDEVLQNGVGHLEGSSLPIGGPGTHAVLSGHTGLPSAKLFTDIDQLVEGDRFTVRVLKDTLTYQVDQILVVLPYETDALEIEAGEDYCTLLTCTPYGINTHRLLVRGRRVPVPPEEMFSAAVEKVPDNGIFYILMIALLALAVLVTALLRKRAKRLKKMRHLAKVPRSSK